jgi:ribosomal-protein-alanine N-acetyltransferase
VEPGLRWWTAADAAALQQAATESPDLAAQLGDAALGSVRECAAVIEERLADRRTDTVNLALTMDGWAVGNVGVTRIERRHSTAWVSYWLTTSFRGRGLLSRGLASAAGWAHQDLGIFRLELGHRVDNVASCAVARAVGFRAEGLERAKLLYGDERFDVETHARLSSDPLPVVAGMRPPRIA